MHCKLQLSLISFLLAVVFQPTAFAQNASLSVDLASLKQRVELLEAQLKAMTLERDVLKKELEDLKNDEDESEDGDYVPIDSVWQGLYRCTHSGNTGTSAADFRVTNHDGKSVTFLQTIENGAIRAYDCEFTSKKKFKIVAVRRVGAADAVIYDPTLPPVGEITGSGTADGKKLSLQLVWREATFGQMSGRFELQPTR